VTLDTLVGGAALALLGLALATPLLRALSVPDELYPLSLSYVRIYFLGFTASMLNNVGAGALRAIGDSVTPLRALTIACVVNIAGDLVLVGLLGLGVLGAALATLIAQILSAAFVLAVLRKMRRTHGGASRFRTRTLMGMTRVGLPIGLQATLYPFANMIIQSAINRLGTDSIAAWALCGKLDFLVWIITDSLASAISTFAAQNYGAGQACRTRRGVWAGLAITLGLIGILSVVLYLWPERLGTLFLGGGDHDILPLTGRIMRLIAPFYCLYVVGEVLSCGVKATGRTLVPMLLTLASTWLLRVLWILFVVPRHQALFSVLVVYPVSWFANAFLMSLYYARFLRLGLFRRGSEGNRPYH